MLNLNLKTAFQLAAGALSMLSGGNAAATAYNSGATYDWAQYVLVHLKHK